MFPYPYLWQFAVAKKNNKKQQKIPDSLKAFDA
jgi:hypothetical protein